MSADLLSLLEGNRYNGYVYGYPHKTAYRPLNEPTTVAQAWAGENRAAVFGYLHLPFCEMRCGFCNLFTTANPRDELVSHYLTALEREAETVREALPDLVAARLAIGGGTPTYLEPDALERVLLLLGDTFAADLRQVPTSVETSPATASADRLRVLTEHGVRRVSIGVQAFDDDEVHRVGRPQHRADVVQALNTVREVGPPVLNIDLMYGLEGQTETSWLASLATALTWQPEEIFCYPLYVRQLTGLGRQRRDWDDQRLRLYRIGRDFMRENGYQQTSMRRFTRLSGSQWVEPEYSCQDDGMLGLGCGARSYTRGLHYSREYAVGRTPVRGIIERYCATTDFTVIEYGFALQGEEQQRRYLLQSLLHTDGLNLDSFAERFGVRAQEALPQLQRLAEIGFLEEHSTASQTLCLTEAGLECSDAIGPWLFSARVNVLSGGFSWQ